MLFNSQIFILIFLPICLGIFACARRAENRAQILKLVLLTASWIFYSYWDLRLFPVLMISLIVNYALSHLIASKVLAPRLAILSVAILNLGFLGYFKYLNFFSGAIAELTGLDMPVFTIWLPLGISFFTFQQISYLVDLSKGRAPLYSGVDYCLYISFFPQLIAGPIVRHHQLVPQFASLGQVTEGQVARGLTLFFIGLVKKVVFADQLAALVSPVFSAALKGNVANTDVWIAALGFILQIYYDFSAYSDMAIGLALLFGLTLPINFNSPYKAISLIDLWRRWHITLTSFLRDYVYVPIGLSLKGLGEVRNYIATLVTFILSGFWHGAGWNFLLWGAWNGVGLCLNLKWRKFGYRLPMTLAWFLTFSYWTIGGLFFRAESFGSIGTLLVSAVSITQNSTPTIIDLSIADGMLLFTTLLMVVSCPNSQELADKKWWKRAPVGVAAGASLVVLAFLIGGGREQEFIYFEF